MNAEHVRTICGGLKKCLFSFKNTEIFRNRRVCRAAELALLFVAVGLHLYSQLLFLDEFMDDAYITLAYAKNWVGGLGLVANPGEWVESYSNPFWLLVSSLPFLAGWDPLMFLKLVCMLCGIATVATAWFYCTRVLRMHWLFAFWGLALFSLNPWIGRHFTWGLETGQVGLVVLWMLIVSSFPGRRAIFPSIFIGAILAISRPEGFLYFPALVLSVFLSNLASKGFRSAFSSAAVVGLGLALWLGVVFGIRYSVYGLMFPNPYYVKVPSIHYSHAQGFAAVEALWLNLGLPLVVGVAITLAFAIWYDWKTFLRLFLIVFTGFFFIWYLTEDWMGLYRFASHIYIVFCIFLAWCFDSFWKITQTHLRAWASWPKMRGCFTVPVGAMVLCVALHAMARSVEPMIHTYDWKGRGLSIPPYQLPKISDHFGYLAMNKALHNLKQWEFQAGILWLVAPQMEFTRPGYTSVLPDVGLAVYASRNQIVDTKGLLNRSTADFLYFSYRLSYRPNARDKLALAEAEDRLREDIRRRKPEMAILWVTCDQNRQIIRGVNLVERVLVDMPEFKQNYRITTQQPSPGTHPLIFCRSDVPPLLPEEILANYYRLYRSSPRSPNVANVLIEAALRQKKMAEAALLLKEIYHELGPSRHFRYTQWARELADDPQPIIKTRSGARSLNVEDAVFWQAFPNLIGGWFNSRFYGNTTATWTVSFGPGQYRLALYAYGIPCQEAWPLARLEVLALRNPFPGGGFETGTLENWEVTGTLPSYQPVYRSDPFFSSDSIRFFNYVGDYWLGNVGALRAAGPYSLLSLPFVLEQNEKITVRLGGEKTSQNSVDLLQDNGIVAHWVPADAQRMQMVESGPCNSGTYRIRVNVKEPDKELMFDDVRAVRPLLSEKFEVGGKPSKIPTSSFCVWTNTNCLVRLSYLNAGSGINANTKQFESRDLVLQGLRVIREGGPRE